jgi:hypothetical protein
MRRIALLAAVAVAVVAATPALAHEGNPDYESVITAVEGVEGLRAEILNGDDRLLLVNTGSAPVIVEGYDGEPYARIQPRGTVEVNERSSATYLNEERFGQVDVPAAVDPKAPPKWKAVGRNGRFEFHDHRVHWMLENKPPKVDDESKRTKIMDWKVPLRAGSTSASIDGQLFWRGRSEGVSPAIIALCALLILGSLIFFVVRQRRRRVGTREAW